MKRIPLLALLVLLAGCGANPNSPAAPFQSPSTAPAQPPATAPTQPPAPAPSQPAATTTYDMLAWMTMDPSLGAAHHMAGTANPVYTTVLPDRFLWTKTGQGYPWDIQLYDNNYIYLWVTELDWHNPNTFKAFHSATSGNYNLPLAPRFAQGGYPGSVIKVAKANTTYDTHSDCNTYTTQDLGYVINSVWGPYQETLGGDLPANLQTLVISYQYSCDSSYSNCGDKEEFHIAQPYGLVYWQHQKLQSNGTYATADNKTYLNMLATGQVTPVTTCF